MEIWNSDKELKKKKISPLSFLLLSSVENKINKIQITIIVIIVE